MCIKKIVATLRAISGKDHPKNFTTAIIAAAGASVRFGTDLTKQLTCVCGEPLLAHTLRAYNSSDCIHEIIIVARYDEIPVWRELCNTHGFDKVTRIVCGGSSRQESVRLGLDSVSDRSKYVAIADGARCLTTPEQISSVCRAAYKYRAATAAHRSTDSVKIANSKGFIDSSLDRDTVWLAQTPQVFKTNLYRAAAYTAFQSDFEAADDNSVVENVGHPIRLVECGSQNIKVTFVEDVKYAEAVISDRKSKEATV